MRNTAPDKLFSQKINIITAMASDGEVWIALTTRNTDSEMMMLFMTHLASELTKEYRDWRNSTVFLLDGVSVFMLFEQVCRHPITRVMTVAAAIRTSA